MRKIIDLLTLFVLVFTLSACAPIQLSNYSKGNIFSIALQCFFNDESDYLDKINLYPRLEIKPGLSQTVTGIFGYPDNINPLTGLAVDNTEILNRRPVLVKVSNFPPEGRPHAGLSFADIVFEYYIGEWTNRFLAIYYGQDAIQAWPLRSGRLVDAQLTNMYKGILAYGNAYWEVDDVLMNILGERAISFNEAPCPAICGEATHNATGVYVNTAEVSKYASKIGIDNVKQDVGGMLFSDSIQSPDHFGVWVAVQYIRWNRGEWFYDIEKQKYVRWIESWNSGKEYPMIPLVDKLTGEQLAFSNVIIMYANYIEYATTLHDIDIWNNTEGQRAIIFRDGMAIDGYWRTIGEDKPIQFLTKSGLPIPLKPGNTWIGVAGTSSQLEQPGDGQWRLLFDIP